MSQPDEKQTPANPDEGNSHPRDPMNVRNVQTRNGGTNDGQNNVQPSGPRSLRSVFNLELFFDFLLIVVTAIYVFFAYHQWKAIEKQGELMSQQLVSFKDSSAQTERLIKANEELAKLNASLVRNSGEQVKASIAQAEAATQQAQIAQESFYIGDRPYVTVPTAVLEKFEAGTVPNIAVGFINSGKTPALDLEMSAVVSIEKFPRPNIKKYLRMSQAEFFAEQIKNIPFPSMPEGSNVLLPSGGKMVAQIRGSELTTPLFADIVSAKLFLFVWGSAIYKDGLGKTHGLKFCLFYSPKDDSFVACPTFNSIK